MVRVLVAALAMLVLAVGPARAQAPADAVALLPLDADKHLELYGQPVASEVARALVAGGIDVVVVGPKMAVPARARLIVDGTIKADKGEAVTLTARVRDPRDGTVLETIVSTAPKLTSIDHAAADLSSRVLPVVRTRLASLHRAPPATPEHVSAPPVQPAPAAAPARPVLAVVTAGTAGGTLAAPLTTAMADWIRAHHRAPDPVAATQLGAHPARAVAAAHAELAIALDVRRFAIDPGRVPLARAWVRVRVVDASHVVFDRVVITDTVVGDRGMSDADLASRVAREVLAIAEPHVRRRVSSWR